MSTKKQVWQYRCDFCTKRNLSAGSIAKHEKHCTMNPARICRMCVAGGIGDEQKPISALTACLSLDKADYGIEELKDLAQQCPACVLAGIRQSKIRETYRAKFATEQEWSEAGGPLDLKWDFKEALKEFWSEVNSAQAEYY
jgi:hypothetical protein